MLETPGRDGRLAASCPLASWPSWSSATSPSSGASLLQDLGPDAAALGALASVKGVFHVHKYVENAKR